MEVCCPEASSLSAEVLRLGGSAVRLGLHNGHDLSTYQGYLRSKEMMMHTKPRHMWVSTPCALDSPLQNLKQKIAEQGQALAAKREVNR